MSEQQGSSEEKPRDTNQNTTSGQNPRENKRESQRGSGSRRRRGQRGTRSSSDSATSEVQSSRGKTQTHSDQNRQKGQRSQNSQNQSAKPKRDSTSQEENRTDPRRSNSRRRRRYRPGSSQGEGQNGRDGANQTVEKAADPQSGETSQKSNSQSGGENRSQGASRRKRRSRRSSQRDRRQPENRPEKNAQEAENSANTQKTGSKRRSGRDAQSQSGRRDSERTKDGSSQASNTGKAKRGSKRPSITRRSPRRIFSPGRDSEGIETETSGRNSGTYVSLLNTFSQRPAPSVPIPTDRGIKARSQDGVFSQNWWARRWIESMEQLVDPARLQRGRSYARIGQVLSITETQYGVEARVQGSRPAPYKVLIQVTPLTDDQWQLVIDAMSEQALFTAQLLAGEMPTDIEEAFQTAGVSLFPDRPGDLFTSCSCPDWANPCKHVAATHYILGDRFDDDPFLLFRMRGRSQEQILSDLNKRRGNPEETEENSVDTEEDELIDHPSPEDLLEHFWEPAESLDTFPLTIKPPSIDMPLMTRLGEPAFLPGLSLLNILRPVYQTFTYSALRAAYSEEEPVESNPVESNPDQKEPINGSSDE